MTEAKNVEEIFGWELQQIKNNKIRDLARRVLMVAPDYFWIVPASSTGKYHNKTSLGRGGLVRHVKFCVKLALSLFENTSCTNFTDEEKDLIIAALILHDCVKNSFNINNKYTVIEHPLLVKELFKKIGEEDFYYAKVINSLIETHYGQWNKNKKGEEVLPLPKNRLQRFCHMIDYISSRKFLEMTVGGD